MLSQIQAFHHINCYSKDNQGLYLFVNPAQVECVNASSANDFLGKSDRELPWHKPRLNGLLENDQSIIKTRTSQVFIELGLFKKKPQWYRSFKSPILGNTGKIMGVFGVSIPIQAKSLIPLTKQQTACLKQLALGLTLKQIALILGLSPKTVEHYLDNVKTKLNCQSRTELILQAIERGLVNLYV